MTKKRALKRHHRATGGGGGSQVPATTNSKVKTKRTKKIKIALPVDWTNNPGAQMADNQDGDGTEN